MQLCVTAIVIFPSLSLIKRITKKTKRDLYVCIPTVHIGTYAQELQKYSRITRSQKSLLERAFNKSIYLSKSKLRELAQQSGLSERKVNSWLLRRREKLKFERRQKGPSSSKVRIHIHIKLKPLMNTYICTCT